MIDVVRIPQNLDLTIDYENLLCFKRHVCGNPQKALPGKSRSFSLRIALTESIRLLNSEWNFFAGKSLSHAIHVIRHDLPT